MHLRRIPAVLLAAVCLFTAGCARSRRSLLWYQESLVSVTLSDGGTLWEITPAADGWTLTVLSPPGAAGVRWHVTDTAASVSSGGVTIPAGNAMAAVPRRLISLFRLSEERLLGAEADKKGSAVIARYQTDAGEVTVRIGAGGVPLSFSAPDGAWTVTDIRTAEQEESQESKAP